VLIAATLSGGVREGKAYATWSPLGHSSITSQAVQMADLRQSALPRVHCSRCVDHVTVMLRYQDIDLYVGLEFPAFLASNMGEGV